MLSDTALGTKFQQLLKSVILKYCESAMFAGRTANDFETVLKYVYWQAS